MNLDMEWFLAISLAFCVVGMMLAGASCCCGVACVIDDDEFDDATIGPQWSVVSGSWVESGGTLSTSSSSAEILNLTPHPDSLEEMYVQANVSVVSGTVVEVRVNRVDANNSYVAQFSLFTTSVVVAIYRRSGGVDTLLESKTPLVAHDYTTAKLEVCMSEHGISAVAAGGSAFAVVAGETATAHAGGYQFSLGLSSGSVSFSDVTFAKHFDTDANCPACQGVCAACCAAESPPFPFYRVNLGVGGWVSNRCNDCEAVSGEFIVDQSGQCAWSYTDDLCTMDLSACPGCGVNPATFALDLTLTGSCTWLLNITTSVGPTDPSCACHVVTFAVYESAALADDGQCQSLPVTLTKTSETVTGANPNPLCTGSLPLTITLEAA